MKKSWIKQVNMCRRCDKLMQRVEPLPTVKHNGVFYYKYWFYCNECKLTFFPEEAKILLKHKVTKSSINPRTKIVLNGQLQYCLEHLHLCSHWEQKFLSDIQMEKKLTTRQDIMLEQITETITNHLKAGTEPNQCRLVRIEN